MTPQEKAKELVIRFVRNYSPDKGEVLIEDHIVWTSKNRFHIGHFANCALIAVDEMYNIAHKLDDMATVGYLIDVKNEIEKL